MISTSSISGDDSISGDGALGGDGSISGAAKAAILAESLGGRHALHRGTRGG